jgi:hypothetical protein
VNSLSGLSIQGKTDRRHDRSRQRAGPTTGGTVMAQFVLTFRNRRNHVPTDAEGAAWMTWFEQIGPSLADGGSRVGATSSLGAAPTESAVTGYTVVNAPDLEAAVLLAKGCPGLSHGGAVEIGELVAM